MADKTRVLVVDGEDRFLKVLIRLLENCGYSVTAKKNGAEALAEFIERPYPLVITDVEIPDMTGIELLQLIKEQNDLTEIIVMNSVASINIAIAAMRAGAYDYLVKPFKDREVICNTTHRALEKFKLHRQNKNLIEALKQHNRALESTNTRLRKLATHDDLTGLYNHRYFQERLKIELNRAKRYPEDFSILFIDLDYFKKYNDTNGHLAGDQLLRTLSQLFMNFFRKTDMVARYGGDEFVVILPETPKDLAQRIAAKFHERVAQHPFAHRKTMPNGCVTVSLGMATFPHDGTTANALLHQADQKLYDGKKMRGQFTP